MTPKQIISILQSRIESAEQENIELRDLLREAVQKIDPHGVGLCSESGAYLAAKIRAALQGASK